jgi:hypothetical protein
MLMFAVIVAGQRSIPDVWILLPAVAVFPPLVYRWCQFYSIYGVFDFQTEKHGISIGHRNSFVSSSRKHLIPSPWELVSLRPWEVVEFDNGMLILFEQGTTMEACEEFLSECLGYRKFWPLIASSKRYTGFKVYDYRLGFLDLIKIH